MLYCRKCKVNIKGDRCFCPLCGGGLTGEPEEEAYPPIAPMGVNRGRLIQTISFCAICTIVIGFICYLILRFSFWWFLFGAAAIGGLWVTVLFAVLFRSHIFKAVTIEFFLISGFLVLADLATGWYRWSLDYAIPCACLASMFSMMLIAKFLKIPASEHLTYFALDAIYGIVPIVFIFTGVLNFIIPSAICVGVSLISIAALLLFEGKNMKYELKKRLHF